MSSPHKPVEAQQSHEFFLEVALNLAKSAAEVNEVPVGAVVVHEGGVIARGKNTREHEQNPLGHAELNALQDAAKKLKSWRLVGCTLYVTLEPCPMCLAACQQARVKKVVYGAKDEKGGALCLGFHVHLDPRTNHRFEVEWVPHAASSKILKDFFAQKRSEKKT